MRSSYFLLSSCSICSYFFFFFFFNAPSTTQIYTLSLHDALPIYIAFSMSTDGGLTWSTPIRVNQTPLNIPPLNRQAFLRSEEHTSELQSRLHLVCRLLLEKKKKKTKHQNIRLQNNIQQTKATHDI